MKIKDGVIISGLQECMRPILKHAGEIWRKQGEELVITAGLDGEHSAGSLHPYGKAVDLRIRYFDEDTKRKVAHELKKTLGCYCDVIVHKTHIHVEYDPK